MENQEEVAEAAELLVTLHLDVLNACCASKLIAAACAAPKFNAKFSKHNNVIRPQPTERHPHPLHLPPSLSPSRLQLLFGESCYD